MSLLCILPQRPPSCLQVVVRLLQTPWHIPKSHWGHASWHSAKIVENPAVIWYMFNLEKPGHLYINRETKKRCMYHLKCTIQHLLYKSLQITEWILRIIPKWIELKIWTPHGKDGGCSPHPIPRCLVHHKRSHWHGEDYLPQKTIAHLPYFLNCHFSYNCDT
jgi:hypothetical protein